MLCSCLFQHPAHYRALLIQYIYVVFQELSAICGIKRMPSQEGVFSLLMMHGLFPFAIRGITVFSREGPHLLREKRMHKRKQQETSFISLFKTKYMQYNTHRSIQTDYTKPISLLHRLTRSILFNRWRTICSME